MSRNHDSIKYQIRQAVEYGKIRNQNTKHSYRRSIDKVSEWLKANGIRDLSAVTTAVIQQYETDLAADPKEYSPATIHGYLIPICKAAGVPLDRIRKPKRSAATITRSRRENANTQGNREAERPENQRLVSFQRAVGIRRSELARLKGRDLIEDNGQLFVLVERGKGGKRQRQWILPADQEIVRQTFAGIAPDQSVFSGAEMANKIDLHSIRAEHARDCYAYYAKLVKRPGAADRLRRAMLRRFDAENGQLLQMDPAAYRRKRDKFIADMGDAPYLLRGENREKAIAAGQPTEYNRLCLLATSVFHLSHWRLDVTVTNYLVRG